MTDSFYGCEVQGCSRHVANGDTIYRTSPTGGPFRGRCIKHLQTPPDPEEQDICEIIEADGRPANGPAAAREVRDE